MTTAQSIRLALTGLSPLLVFPKTGTFIRRDIVGGPETRHISFKQRHGLPPKITMLLGVLRVLGQEGFIT